MARRRSWIVRDLATASHLDNEAVLVALWGEGIEYVEAPSDRVLAHDSVRAERAVGIGGSRQRLVSHWEIELGLSRDNIASLIADGGYSFSPSARTLPKGAIRLLERTRTLKSEVHELPAPALPLQPLDWRQVGSLRTREHLSAEDVEAVHRALEQDFAAAEDPISPAGVRSPDLLQSAVERPRTTFLGTPKYETLVMCAAALVHSLVHNHPFHNGNKRTALVSLLVLLDRNDVVLESTEDELFRFFLIIASHALLPSDRIYEQRADHEVLEIAQWINQRTRALEGGERTVPWRTLQRMLRDLNCEITQHRGDKLRITRTIVIRRGGWLRAQRERVLQTFYTNTGDGREVPRSVLKRIRADLELDGEHGVDSGRFYSSRREPDTFISEYSRLLKRLARV